MLSLIRTGCLKSTRTAVLEARVDYTGNLSCEEGDSVLWSTACIIPEFYPGV
jgi:hypothetical protein